MRNIKNGLLVGNRFFTLEGWNELQEQILCNPICQALEHYFMGLEKPIGSKPVRFRLLWHLACLDIMRVRKRQWYHHDGEMLLRQLWQERRGYFDRWGEDSCLLFIYWYLLGAVRKLDYVYYRELKDCHHALHHYLMMYWIPKPLRRSARHSEKASMYEDRKKNHSWYLIKKVEKIMDEKGFY